MGNIKFEMEVGTDDQNAVLALGIMLAAIGKGEANGISEKTETAKNATSEPAATETKPTETAPVEKPKRKTVAEKKAEEAAKSETPQTEKEAETEPETSKTEPSAQDDFDEESADENTPTESLSVEEYKKLIRPLLSEKAKIDGAREKIRKEFTAHGATGIGNLADDKLEAMYNFLQTL